MKAIPDNYLKDICKIGQGKECCRFIVAGPDGIECAKHSGLHNVLMDRADQGQMTAIGDNCDGLSTTL